MRSSRSAFNAQPILIGGCERSGTTMLGSLLGGHPDILTLPATQFISDAVAGLPADDIDRQLPAIAEAIRAHPQWTNWPIKMPALTPNMRYRELIEAMINDYAQTQGVTDFRFWVSHSPSNIRHAHLMRQLFADARFVHIIRDGRAVAASYRDAPWRIASTYRLSGLWMQRVAYGLALELQWPEQVFRIHYEPLVHQPAAELSRLCHFLGIHFVDSMTTGEGFRHERPGDLVGQAPQPLRINAWQHTLSAKEIEQFEFFTKDFLPMLGYERFTPHTPRMVGDWAKLAMLLQDGYKFIRDTFRR